MFRTALVALDLLDVLPIKRPLLQCLPDLKNWGIGKIVLAHVIHDPHGQRASAVHKKSYLDELEQCAKPLRECGIDAVVVVRDSSKPAEDILAIARDNSADLIVIGSRSQDVITKPHRRNRRRAGAQAQRAAPGKDRGGDRGDFVERAGAPPKRRSMNRCFICLGG